MNFLCVGTFLIFLTLKLINYIDWSWWWVTGPLWIPLAICLLIWLIGVFLMYLSQRSFKAKMKKR